MKWQWLIFQYNSFTASSSSSQLFKLMIANEPTMCLEALQKMGRRIVKVVVSNKNPSRHHGSKNNSL